MGMKELEAQLSTLTDRVTWLEQQSGVSTPEEKAADQERQDQDTLSRHPASYAEAVEFKAAQRRQAARDGNPESDDEASLTPETPPES